MEYAYCPFCGKNKHGEHHTRTINGKEQTWFMCNDCDEYTYGNNEEKMDNSPIVLVPYVDKS